MGLVSYSYYKDTYLGEPVASSDFARYEKRAEGLVLGLIRKTAIEVDELSAELQEKIEDAICAEIDYLYNVGVETATYGRAAGGFTVGKVSVQAGAGSGKVTAASSMICPAVYALLETTGLLYPGVPTGAEPWPATRGWI